MVHTYPNSKISHTFIGAMTHKTGPRTALFFNEVLERHKRPPSPALTTLLWE